MGQEQTGKSRKEPVSSEKSRILLLREEISRLLPEAMLWDSYRIREKLVQLLSSNLPRRNPARATDLLLRLKQQLEESAEEKRARHRKKPRLSYPHDLPITRHRLEIIRAIKENRVVIVCGETGCGKSTQLPKMCLEAGRGLSGKIACTQPRRIAAMTIALRISEELDQPLGKIVGYKIRFQDRTSPGAYIKILTDGMLLAETQGDRLLTEYDTIIIDEAHERSLNIDFLIGLCRRLLDKRPELKILITSATLEVEKFAKAFNHPPLFRVSGRLYPVEVSYFEPEPVRTKKEEPDYVDLAVQAVDFIKKEKQPGDILVFMPTEQDILETCRRLQGKHYPGSVILQLFARMPAHQQKQIYNIKEGKIVVATNVAETSLTIPGIRYVVDTGLARLSQYQTSSGIHSLPITPISQASAEQRKGRCGRVSAGLCLRLYSEEDYLSRPEHTPPEILRSNLAEVILRMLDLELGDPLHFPFLDPPAARAVRDGYRTLLELGAIEKTETGYELTDLGRKMARFPLDPRLSRLLLEAERRGCLQEATVIAAALSIQDPRLRPLERAADADRVQSVFQHPESDFLTYYNLWQALQSAIQGQVSSPNLKKFARDYFLSYNRLREWLFVQEQILEILEEQKISLQSRKGRLADSDLYAALHKSLLSGFISHLAAHKEKNIYEAARSQEAMLWPGSALFRKPPAWVVAAELVRTNRLYLRTVARVNPAWAEELAPHLCRYSYEDPYWDKNRSQVRAKERVTIFNLAIIPGRDVPYGRQNPEAAHEVFVDEALVKHQVNRDFPFLEHNHRLVSQVRLLEEKLRQRNILIPEHYLFDFYSSRLQGVYSLEGLEQRIKNAGSDDFLRLKEENLYLTKPEPEQVEKYPDSLKILGHTYQLKYRFAPGEEDDGVTILIPRRLMEQVPEALLTWPVPGRLQEKVEACLKALPKEYRKLLQPLAEKAEQIAAELKPAPVSFFTALAAVLKDRYKLDLPRQVWEKLEIPRHLKMRIAIINEAGQEVLTGRDLNFLKKMLSSQARQPAAEEAPGWREARARWERPALAGWEESLPEIPEEVAIDDFLKGYPALVTSGDKFEVRLFRTAEEARQSHLLAVENILSRQFQKDLNFILRSYTFPEELRPVMLFFGGEAGLKNRIIQKIREEVFRKNFRRLEELQAFIQEAALKQLFETAHRVFSAVQAVLQEYQKTRSFIQEMEEARKKMGVSSSLPESLKEELESLVPENFPVLYPADFLARLPRMVEALGLRAQRARLSAEKDRTKAAQVEPFLAELERLGRLLRKNPSPEKERLLFELRWMIEEFKISLFAPEIKTAFPVSAKRLATRIREIEARLEQD
ncbi:MAG: ATP-dependent RNA helicase HrpA [Candidatus Saccharicenans sp.]|uniref:ATP-dependent RNA helicase HrpA n=1 Tax=Candidatus Saccharicenans sp. TaxID=2819258 RepID=UPI0040492CAE